MGNINVLDFSIANLIAAGEVVERPASVVKELLENSIDSGADMITVEIKKGGVSFIRVADNGCGMAAEDLPIAIKRHATSKIRTAKDLDAIFTLGFRGEALAAIASVSDLRILSRTKDSDSGNMLTSSAGEGVSISECGCSSGTTVIVENLFSTVPARRKFLKKDSTETMAVSAVVEKIALSHPEISIKFIADGSIKYATAGDGILLNAIYAVLGRDFATRLLEVSSSGGVVKISGYIGRPENVRANRNFQNVFINGRYIKSKTIGAALEQAFTSYIQPEKFPACVLFVEVPPSSVDVNVHPAKLEVKFANEKEVFESVYYAVRSALERITDRPAAEFKLKAEQEMREVRSVSAFVPIKTPTDREEERRSVPQITIESTGIFSRSIPDTKEKNNVEAVPVKSKAVSPEPFVEEIPLPPEPGSSVGIFRSESVSDVKEPYVEPVKSVPLPKTEELQTVMPISSEPTPVQDTEPSADPEEKTEEIYTPEPYRFVGVLFDCYIIAELENKIVVIDKHAAHERIIFESLRENTKKSHRSTQLLLIPIEVRLSSEEYAALSEYKTDFENTGFSVSFSSDNTVSVTEIPVDVETSDVPDMVVTLASRLSAGLSVKEDTEKLYEKALYQAACKAAVKGGRHDETETVKQICDTVMKDPRIRYCPHGRPVALEMTKSHFDRQFSRI
ncbi:MAG: DNA mismatch repair endonuclease MutL [Clostridia bacterium]|nr:DNA mismatch repair endonuclease MutL [Clostridia bacterium]